MKSYDLTRQRRVSVQLSYANHMEHQPKQLLMRGIET